MHLQSFVPGESQVVTLIFKDATLEKVFTEIRKQTGYAFAYSEVVLAKAKRINVNLKNTRMQDALNTIFQDQPLTYTIVEKVIVIKESTEKKIMSEQSSLQPLAVIDVRGLVLNEKGDPVAGVTVRVKESLQKGTFTNADGEFQLTKVDPQATLVLTAVNIETIEVKVVGRNNLNIQVKGKTGKLDEVQVIAYGTTSQRFNTGNTVTVKAEDIEKQPVQNPLLALQGRVPGLTVVQNSGMPGGGVTIRLQGQTSISGSNGNDPLIVVDGVPFVSQALGTVSGGGTTNTLGSSGGAAYSGAGSPLNYINPGDIESIDVLKDADAVAIYGSRAANGAILITTKKGKAGKLRVDLNTQQGWGTISRKQDLLNTQQYLAMRREAYRNDRVAIPSIIANPTDGNYDLNGQWDTTRYTDWQDVLIGGTAKYTNLGLSFSGGTTNVQYLVGATYNKTTTVFRGGDNDQRGTVHFNISGTSTDRRLKIRFTGSYMFDDNRLSSDLTQYIFLAPNAPNLFTGEGLLNWDPTPAGNSSWRNPLAYLNRPYENKTNNLLSNLMLAYSILPGLEIKSSFGFTSLTTDEFYSYSFNYYPPETNATRQRTANYSRSTINSWIVEPQLSYDKTIGEGKLKVLVGGTLQQRTSDGYQLVGAGYNSDQVMRDLLSAATLTSGFFSVNAVYKYTGAFGRIGYNYLDKYLINLSARRDGSSRFGDKNKFYNFGALGIGWIFTEERPIKTAIPWMTFGKIRASYGTSGNDQIPDYAYMNFFSAYPQGLPYQGIQGIAVGRLTNPYLQWEETRKLQVGFDLGFIGDRILVSATYVRNRSSNQLLPYILPSTTGSDEITENLPATVQNTAIEVMINTVNLKTPKLKWSSSLNFTLPENRLLDFPNLERSSYADLLIIGEPLNFTRVYKMAGVNPLTGVYVIEDYKGQPTANPVLQRDARIFVPPYPALYGGLHNTIAYGDWQLDFLFQFTKQMGRNYLYANGTPGNFLQGLGNQPEIVMERWQKPGDITMVQKFAQNTSLNSARGHLFRSDMTYADASYIRLKNVSLAWIIPNSLKQKLRIENGKLYLQAQNLLTFTNYIGVDPETQSTVLPPLRMITVGIQVNL